MKQRVQLTKFKQELGVKVGEIMTRKLILVSPETSIEACVRKMVDNKVGAVLVTDKDKRLLGLIAKLDILRLIPQNKDLRKVRAKDIMIKKVKTISPDVDLYMATIFMKKTKIKKLPVIEQGKVIGMLHAKDIVKMEPQLFEHMLEAIYIKEESEKLKRRDERMSRRLISGIEPHGSLEGPCEECGNFDMLEEFDGRLLCIECRDTFDFKRY